MEGNKVVTYIAIFACFSRVHVTSARSLASSGTSVPVTLQSLETYPCLNLHLLFMKFVNLPTCFTRMWDTSKSTIQFQLRENKTYVLNKLPKYPNPKYI